MVRNRELVSTSREIPASETRSPKLRRLSHSIRPLSVGQRGVFGRAARFRLRGKSPNPFRISIGRVLAHYAVSEEDAQRILFDNAAEIYGFDRNALKPHVERVGFELSDVPSPEAS